MLTLPECGIHIAGHRHDRTRPEALHRHAHPSLMLVVAGKGTWHIGDQRFAVAANMAVTPSRGTLHRLVDQAGSPLTVFVVYFSDALARLHGDLYDALAHASKPLPVPPSRVAAIRRALRQMLHEQSEKPAHWETALSLCLGRILLELRRALHAREARSEEAQAGSSLERVAKVLEDVRLHSYEPISLSQAARLARMSVRQFSNLCRQRVGESFVRYLNALRADRAAELLRHTTMPVTAVAFEVGYEDLSTFYRAFRKRHGRAPGALRLSSGQQAAPLDAHNGAVTIGTLEAVQSRPTERVRNDG